MSEPTKVHLTLPDEPGYWWIQSSSGSSLHCVNRIDDWTQRPGIYWTKAEIADPPPIPEPKLPRLFRWKGMVGVVFELDCHSTRNIILQDADHLQYHHQDDWLRKHASEIEWIDTPTGEGE